MRAIVVDREGPTALRLADAPDPVPAPHEALVRVVAASLNYGEVAHAHGAQDNDLPPFASGTVLGHDAAGVVAQAAADGSGPAVGTPVVTFGADGGWAELRAVPTSMLGAVPAGSDLGAVSTVPVAGLSALRALRRIGDLLGKRVMITGASGGVGRYAVQLAAQAGAEVVATTRDVDRRRASLVALGASEVVAHPSEASAPVHGVLDQVGGRQLVAAFDMLAPHGTLVSVGHSAHEAETFPFGLLFGDAGRHDRSVVTFFLGAHTDLSEDLAWLAARVASGQVDPGIAWRGSWEEAEVAFTALLEHRLGGKAVIDIT